MIVNVRDGTKVAAGGTVKTAFAVSRSLLEAKPDPDLPTHDPARRKDRPVILYCDSGGRGAPLRKTLVDMGFTDRRNVGGFKGLAMLAGRL